MSSNTLLDHHGDNGGRALSAATPYSPGYQQSAPNLSARQLWRMVARHWKLIAVIVAVTTAVVLTSQLMQEKVYESTAMVQVELNDSSGANQADEARNMQRVNNEAEIYRSPALAEEVVAAMALNTNPVFTGGPRIGVRQAARYLSSQTIITTSNASDLIDITVRSTSPQLAQRIANQYVESLRQMRVERRRTWRDKLLSDVGVERERLAAELNEAEQAVADFRQTRGMLVGAGGMEDYQQLNRIAVEAASADALEAADAQRAAGVAGAAGARTTAGATSPVLQQLIRQNNELAQQYSDLSTTLGPNHPRMQSLQAQIDRVASDMRREQNAVVAATAAQNAADASRERQLASAEARAAAARAGNLRSRMNQLTGKAYANTANNVELAALERRAEVARAAYITTAERAQNIRAEPDTTGVNSTLVSAATVPTDPISPNPKKATLAALIGSFIIAMLLVLAIELLDNRLRSSEQLARLFGLRTFGMLPQLEDGLPETVADNPVLTKPQSLYSEVSRSMASRVLEGAGHPGRHSVLVTSPLPGDGKSSVALSLAAAATALGHTAVVLDLDLRNKQTNILREIQARSGTPSLLDCLRTNSESGELMLPGAVGPHAAETEDGHTAGPVVLSTTEAIHDPAALIKGWQVARLMNELKDRFDLVVINAPPVLAVHDARTLSQLADQTLVLVKWGKTTIEQLRVTMQMLGGSVTAAVINQVDYARHASRSYGDMADFYMNASRYYSDYEEPVRGNWADRLGAAIRAPFTRTAFSQSASR
ncbi:GumC family protein [Aurantiacibacter spongiae]|uniref:Succinoglycan biosynthesis protein exop n=1 Tax=Aurantiacibacter spongiae TaxID=2488860 RepID=A0A3N5D998_9SPHN|nr:Wzz/FepE/Etk N-terminal domain-containing protein [Aurantiacibacter spongiae]RPF71178.1 succinoglycan biosynthesis protein exop [Aurantiacibacter spongiae]